MRPTTPNFNFSHQAGPSSPPQTPTTPQFQYRQYKTRRNGMFFAPTTATATETPVANPIELPREPRHPTSSPFYASHSELSPRSSSPTSSMHSSIRSTSPPPRSLSSSPEAPPSSSPPVFQKTRVISLMKANFTLEEFRDSEYEDFDSDDGSIIRPSQYEDAESERGENHVRNGETRSDYAQQHIATTTYGHPSSPAQPPITQKPIDPKILHTFTSLRCSDSEGEEDEGYLQHQAWVELQRAEKRRKRRSSSSFKRNFAQSIGSDTDEEDLMPLGPLEANEAGSSARRLRRRTTERTSLIFDDPPARIEELEEPESCEELVEVGEDEVREEMAKNLPYWIQEDMDLDESSSEEEDSDDE